MKLPNFDLDLGPILVGMAVAGAAAVVASGVTLAALADTAGWDGWTKWLLPAAVDVGGAAAGWAWLRPAFPEPARRFGMVVTLACAVASLAGNAVGHLIEADLLKSSAWLVIIVGAIPAAVLVALAHLAALLTDRSATVEVDPIAATDQSTDPRSTTDTTGTGGLASPPVPAAQDPDPIESPRPPVESATGSGAKPTPTPTTPTAVGEMRPSPPPRTPTPTDNAGPSEGEGETSDGPAPTGWREGLSVAAEVEWLASQLKVGVTGAACGRVAGWSETTRDRRMAKARPLVLSENDSQQGAR